MPLQENDVEKYQLCSVLRYFNVPSNIRVLCAHKSIHTRTDFYDRKYVHVLSNDTSRPFDD
jgi:hypothetical protein